MYAHILQRPPRAILFLDLRNPGASRNLSPESQNCDPVIRPEVDARWQNHAIELLR
jgi:hypothetical protein